MATLAELQSEPWWDREIVTSPMVGLGLELRAAYGTAALSFGAKGNYKHLSGGHRSQEWIKNSQYCTNRTYATQDGLTATQARHVSAFDFTPGVWGTADNRAKMRVLTKRMIDAMKAGKLDEVDEVFGTLDGVTVTGWNNDRNAVITADSSHLDHIHVRIDRRFADSNDVMSRIVAVMLNQEEAPMTITSDDCVKIWTHDLHDDVGGVVVVDPAYKVLNRAAEDAKAAKDAVGALNARLSAIEDAIGKLGVKIDNTPTADGGLSTADVEQIKNDLTSIKTDVTTLTSGAIAAADAITGQQV